MSSEIALPASTGAASGVARERRRGSQTISTASGRPMYSDHPPSVMPASNSIRAMLCRVGAIQRFFGNSTGAGKAPTRDPSLVISTPHACSHCCDCIKRHENAIIHGPLVVESAAGQWNDAQNIADEQKQRSQPRQLVEELPKAAIFCRRPRFRGQPWNQA